MVRRPAPTDPCERIEVLELATLGWVHWHNTERLHGYLEKIPPAENDNTLYPASSALKTLVGTK